MLRREAFQESVTSQNRSCYIPKTGVQWLGIGTAVQRVRGSYEADLRLIHPETEDCKDKRIFVVCQAECKGLSKPENL